MKKSTKQELKTALLVLSCFTVTGALTLGFCVLLSKWLVGTMAVCGILLFIALFFGYKANKWREEEELIYKSTKNQ